MFESGAYPPSAADGTPYAVTVALPNRVVRIPPFILTDQIFAGAWPLMKPYGATIANKRQFIFDKVLVRNEMIWCGVLLCGHESMLRVFVDVSNAPMRVFIHSYSRVRECPLSAHGASSQSGSDFGNGTIFGREGIGHVAWLMRSTPGALVCTRCFYWMECV